MNEDEEDAKKGFYKSNARTNSNWKCFKSRAKISSTLSEVYLMKE